MDQLSLLALAESTAALPPSMPPGSRYVPEFVTTSEESRLIALLDAAEWRADLRRRVQHYGFRYDYKKRTLSDDDYLGPLPLWAEALGKRLVRTGIFARRPDQVIVNEYKPGQGIAAHVDRETCFGEIVASLSLAATTVMDLTRADDAIPLVLAPRSLLVLAGPARYDWKHGIAARRRDMINGTVHERMRRLSLTFRTRL